MQKKLYYPILFLLVSLFAQSCGDSCTAPDLSENIIGKWKIVLTGIEIEFKADGTLIDPNDGLLGGEINNVVLNEKTYEVLTASTMRAKAANGSSFVETDYNVPGNFCDELTFKIPGIDIDIKLERL